MNFHERLATSNIVVNSMWRVLHRSNW